jgi:hypothetical protein
MPSCNVCLDLRSGISIGDGEYAIHHELAALRASAERGCPLCACLKEGIHRVGLPCGPGIPDAKIELCIAVKPGISVKIIVRYDGQDLAGDFVNEIEFYTESGMCI